MVAYNNFTMVFYSLLSFESKQEILNVFVYYKKRYFFSFKSIFDHVQVENHWFKCSLLLQDQMHVHGHRFKFSEFNSRHLVLGCKWKSMLADLWGMVSESSPLVALLVTHILTILVHLPFDFELVDTSLGCQSAMIVRRPITIDLTTYLWKSIAALLNVVDLVFHFNFLNQFFISPHKALELVVFLS